MSGTEKMLGRVQELGEPLAHTMGLEILLVEEGTDHGRRVLRIFLDKPGRPEGVTLEDCERFSRALDPILDVEGEIRGQFNLEVSSPGLDRPLTKVKHFEEQLGKVIQVTTLEDIEGRHKFKGILEKVYGGEEAPLLEIQVDREVFSVPLDKIKRAHLDYFASEAIVEKG